MLRNHKLFTTSICTLLLVLILFAGCKVTVREDKQFDITVAERKWSVGMNNRYLQFSHTTEKDDPQLFAEMIPIPLPFETTSMAGNKITGSRFEVDKKGKQVITSADGSHLLSMTEEEGKLTLTIKGCPHIYGLGQRVGGMDLLNIKRGFTLKNQHHYGKQAVMPVPVMYTLDGLVIYMATPYQPKFTFARKGSDALVTIDSKKNGFSLIIMKEENLENAVAAYAKLIGMPPLLPKWMFGYIQSKYGYKSSAEVRAVAARFKELDLPWTGIILDLYWFKNMGDISWDKKAFGDYKKLVKELSRDGVRLINISEPFFTTNSRNYDRFEKAGYFAQSKKGGTEVMERWWGKGSIFDYTNPDAAKVLWNDVYKPLVEDGVAGFWTDLGEPEQVPFTAKFHLGTEVRIHNLYNYYWSKLLYDNFSNDFPEKRLVILSRSGWAPSARFGQGNWSGDAAAKWDGLALQPVQMVSSALSGFSYWASDVGGFVGKGNPDLFVRWNEFGLFSPVYRPHGSHVDREPWAFETTSPQSLKQVSSLLKQRAKLLPYIYSTAWKVSSSGIPFVMPVTAIPRSQSKEDAVKLRNCSYWFGSEVLFRNGGPGTTYDVPLPVSGTWLEMQTRQRYEGNKVHQVEYPMGAPPYFLKPNGILVTNSEATYDEAKTLAIYINSCSEGSGQFIYYNDDGESTDYINGENTLLNISVENSGTNVTIVCDPVKVGYNPGSMPNLELTVYLPAGIKMVNAESGLVEFDQKRSKIMIKTTFPETEPFSMTVSYE